MDIREEHQDSADSAGAVARLVAVVRLALLDTSHVCIPVA